MKADLSRLTFDPLNRFARVLQQQGRPLLDSDWNEQTSILLHRLHLLGRDLIGPHGGPSDACGFEISGFEGGPHDFEIGPGRYYVNGVCCEIHEKAYFKKQPVPVINAAVETGKFYLVFLDVWEDLVNVANHPAMIEPALGGVDTALRTRIAWQVRTHEIAPQHDAEHVMKNWREFVEHWQPHHRGRLRARVASVAEETAPEQPLLSPERRYRGLENQLYRVEIHYGGSAGGGREGGGRDGATFKWSRENGSIMLRLAHIRDGRLLVLDRLDALGAATITAGDWLEEVVPGSGHHDTPRQPLMRVIGRGGGRNEVLVDPATVDASMDVSRPGGVWLRRWDQRARQANRGGAVLRDGTIPVGEDEGDAGWIALEDGLEVQFAPGGKYRPGDYWLIPARVADDGRLLWPEDGGEARALPPYGVEHGYAPLAIVEFKPVADRKQSCRRQFRALATMAI